VKWAINSFAPYKSPGMVAYSQPCCKRDGRMSFLTCSELFMPAWLLATFQPYGARLR